MCEIVSIIAQKPELYHHQRIDFSARDILDAVPDLFDKTRNNLNDSRISVKLLFVTNACFTINGLLKNANDIELRFRTSKEGQDFVNMLKTRNPLHIPEAPQQSGVKGPVRCSDAGDDDNDDQVQFTKTKSRKISTIPTLLMVGSESRSSNHTSSTNTEVSISAGEGDTPKLSRWNSNSVDASDEHNWEKGRELVDNAEQFQDANQALEGVTTSRYTTMNSKGPRRSFSKRPQQERHDLHKATQSSGLGSNALFPSQSPGFIGPSDISEDYVGGHLDQGRQGSEAKGMESRTNTSLRVPSKSLRPLVKSQLKSLKILSEHQTRGPANKSHVIAEGYTPGPRNRSPPKAPLAPGHRASSARLQARTKGIFSASTQSMLPNGNCENPMSAEEASAQSPADVWDIQKSQKEAIHQAQAKQRTAKHLTKKTVRSRKGAAVKKLIKPNSTKSLRASGKLDLTSTHGGTQPMIKSDVNSDDVRFTQTHTIGTRRDNQKQPRRSKRPAALMATRKLLMTAVGANVDLEEESMNNTASQSTPQHDFQLDIVSNSAKATSKQDSEAGNPTAHGGEGISLYGPQADDRNDCSTSEKPIHPNTNKHSVQQALASEQSVREEGLYGAPSGFYDDVQDSNSVRMPLSQMPPIHLGQHNDDLLPNFSDDMDLTMNVQENVATNTALPVRENPSSILMVSDETEEHVPSTTLKGKSNSLSTKLSRALRVPLLHTVKDVEAGGLPSDKASVKFDTKDQTPVQLGTVAEMTLSSAHRTNRSTKFDMGHRLDTSPSLTHQRKDAQVVSGGRKTNINAPSIGKTIATPDGTILKQKPLTGTVHTPRKAENPTLVDERSCRKVQIIKFGSAGPLNQGVPSAPKNTSGNCNTTSARPAAIEHFVQPDSDITGNEDTSFISVEKFSDTADARTNLRQVSGDDRVAPVLNAVVPIMSDTSEEAMPKQSRQSLMARSKGSLEQSGSVDRQEGDPQTRFREKRISSPNSILSRQSPMFQSSEVHNKPSQAILDRRASPTSRDVTGGKHISSAKRASDLGTDQDNAFPQKLDLEAGAGNDAFGLQLQSTGVVAKPNSRKSESPMPADHARQTLQQPEVTFINHSKTRSSSPDMFAAEEIIHTSLEPIASKMDIDSRNTSQTAAGCADEREGIRVTLGKIQRNPSSQSVKVNEDGSPIPAPEAFPPLARGSQPPPLQRPATFAPSNSRFATASSALRVPNASGALESHPNPLTAYHEASRSLTEPSLSSISFTDPRLRHQMALYSPDAETHVSIQRVERTGNIVTFNAAALAPAPLVGPLFSSTNFTRHLDVSEPAESEVARKVDSDIERAETFKKSTVTVGTAPDPDKTLVDESDVEQRPTAIFVNPQPHRQSSSPGLSSPKGSETSVENHVDLDIEPIKGSNASLPTHQDLLRNLLDVQVEVSLMCLLGEDVH